MQTAREIRIDHIERRLERFERRVEEGLRLARDRRERDISLLYEDVERERRLLEARVSHLESRMDRRLRCR